MVAQANPNPLDVIVGSEVKKLRGEQQLSARSCALSLNVTEAHFVMMENGIARFSAEQLFKLAKLFAQPISSFFRSVKGIVPREDCEQ